MFEVCRLSLGYNFYTVAHSVGQKYKMCSCCGGQLAQLLSKNRQVCLEQRGSTWFSFLCAWQALGDKVTDLGWSHGCFSAPSLLEELTPGGRYIEEAVASFVQNSRTVVSRGVNGSGTCCLHVEKNLPQGISHLVL